MLVIPFNSEQETNGLKATRDGYGLMLQWIDLTEDDLFDSIVRLLYVKT